MARERNETKKEREKETRSAGFLPRITANKAARESENGATLERRNRIKARIAFPRSKIQAFDGGTGYILRANKRIPPALFSTR